MDARIQDLPFDLPHCTDCPNNYFAATIRITMAVR